MSELNITTDTEPVEPCSNDGCICGSIASRVPSENQGAVSGFEVTVGQGTLSQGEESVETPIIGIHAELMPLDDLNGTRWLTTLILPLEGACALLEALTDTLEDALSQRAAAVDTIVPVGQYL